MCVDINKLAPLSLLSHIKLIKSLIAIGSSPKKGSSIIYKFGSTKKAQIIITFCFIPFEKCTGKNFFLSLSLNNSSNFSAFTHVSSISNP